MPGYIQFLWFNLENLQNWAYWQAFLWNLASLTCEPRQKMAIKLFNKHWSGNIIECSN